MTKQKICSRLWNSLVIRHDGTVYPCCQVGHREEFRLGNINDNSFEEIINCETVKSMRTDSMNSKLSCYEGCDQVKYMEEFVVENPTTNISSIDVYKDMQIEYGEKCNVDCIMCWQDRSNEISLSQNNLNKIPTDQFESINAYGGEVFVMKDAVKHIRKILSEKKKNLIITTNGLALKSKSLAREIVQNGKGLIISLNATSENMHTYVMKPKKPFFYEMLKNIENVQKYKKEFNREDFFVVGQFTAVIESLDEIPVFIKNFKSMGFDHASITFDHRFFPRYFDENKERAKELAQLIKTAYNNSPNRESINITNREFFDI